MLEEVANNACRILCSRHAVQHVEQRQEDRHLKQQWQAGRHGVDTLVLVQLHRLLSETLAVVTPLLVDLFDLGLKKLHISRRVDLLHEQRNQCGTNHHRQQDDRQRPGPARIERHSQRGQEPVESHQDA
ncbi:hypothetical protein SDC9_202401 [bioreactor metagenome]|uniref:Uncharacterized protein n=1 Tax=bioreactor metagenome TaxID=1076179 RepID=A0A645J2L0_9ZZZZ